jgi:ubiquinone biosynthesis protein COQ4
MAMPELETPAARETPPTASAETPRWADEELAVRVAVDGALWPRLKLGTQALIGLLRNPEDTRQVFVLNLAVNRGHVPELLMRFLTAPGGLELMREQPAVDQRVVERLAGLPEGTFGRAFADHMRRHGLDADLFQAPPGVPPALAYLGQRIRQSHDIWHVLTGYDTSVFGELALQGFTFAHTRLPGQLVLALAGTLRWSLARPRLAREVVEGWRRGRRAEPMLAVRWEELWEVPLEEVRRRLRITPRAA